VVQIAKLTTFVVNDPTATGDDVKEIARHITSPNCVQRRVPAATAFYPEPHTACKQIRLDPAQVHPQAPGNFEAPGLAPI
jgi:hypothetical protein